MVTYSNSETTRKSLIMAAGELFSEHGIDAVTTRAIAKKAGENIGVIHYHFGGKDGLINAVIDFANEPWRNDPLGSFLKSHLYLLKSRNGQNMVIEKMINIFFSICFSPDKPSWIGTLMFQISQRDLEISRKSFNIFAPNIRAFMEVYHTISCDSDVERAYHWTMAIISPVAMEVVNPLAFRRISPHDEPSDKYITKLKGNCVHNALSTIQFLLQLKNISDAKE